MTDTPIQQSAEAGTPSSQALAWLASNRGCELSWGSDDDEDECEWRLHRISGGRNDRQWTVIRWEVFANPDRDEGGWFSYVEDARNYLGGDIHRTKALAVADAKRIAREAHVKQA